MCFQNEAKEVLQLSAQLRFESQFLISKGTELLSGIPDVAELVRCPVHVVHTRYCVVEWGVRVCMVAGVKTWVA